MKRTDIEKNLSKAVSQMVPEDMFERISLNLTPAPEKERTSMKMTVNSNTKKKNAKKYVSLAIAACLVIAVGIFGFAYYDNNVAVESVVDIDVNPSVEIMTNKKDVVLEVKAINADGEKILDGMNLEKSELKVAVNAIIGSMLKNGYLDDDNGILVTVRNEDTQKAAELRNMVVSDIDESLNQHNVSAPVINQTVTDTASAEEFAKANNISVGKATFVLNLAEKDPSLKAEELAKLSLKDIAGIVNAKNVNISDIVDYDADDSIWENIADEVEDVNEQAGANKGNASDTENTTAAAKPQNANGSSNTISAAKAKEIALKHAGIASDKVSYIKAEYDYDDGLRKYEVEFRVENVEYDYEINAVTGAVVSYEKDIEGGRKNQNVSGSNNANTTTTAQSNEVISASKAKEIALKHAGVNASEAAFVKAEYDFDDGVKLYEVEFCVGRVEYEYEINAVTGAVIKSEVDR